jgi:putative endonuclease
VLTRNWHGGGGEIDLIAARADELRFVEVKARRPGDPRSDEALSRRQQARLRLAAKAWLVLNPSYEQLEQAFLVAFVDATVEPWEIRWVDNAFDDE